ncbi:MAG: ester cyclase [Cyclobacteriaceae bacterium]|jgi:ketosteroid isomerase-like protein|nr:ester cyclase [Cyclobacteriaceae bacterium]MDH4296729.1 ester cyclase [Cyclobacteriaceae bacterium]MDH5249952.1 ester cyclase [Cyclobacteriaceae bacterium]
MKQLILSATVCIGLFSCTSPNAQKESQNLAIAKEYMEAVETKDADAMGALLAEDYIGYGPSVGDSTNKADAIASWKYNAENLYESIEYTRHKDLAVTVTEGEAIGDWVLNWAYLTIKYKDGRGPVNVWVNAVYRIENGKIVQSRTFYNEADILRQLGYQMLPPESDE